MQTDVCIIGGGPAGAAAAVRLTQLGYQVCIVERTLTRGPMRQESLALSIAPLLDALGLLATVERSGLLRSAEVQSAWFNEPDTTPNRSTYLVDRAGFDRVLLRAATDAGAIVIHAALASPPQPIFSGWRISVRGQAICEQIEARFLIDARGRRAAVSHSGPPTAALSGRWFDAVLVGSLPRMRIEAVCDAWLWGAPGADRSASILAFVDAHCCGGLDYAARDALYRCLIGRSVLFRDWVRGGLSGRIAVCDATLRADPEPVTHSSIKIGDRAFAMDPISGQGVQAALRSAIHAGAVVHTILCGGDADAAIEFYRDALSSAAAQHRRVAADTYQQHRRCNTPFWRKRSQLAEPSDQRPQPILELSPERRLRLSPEASIAEVPVLLGEVIHRMPAVIHPSLDRPVAWLGHIAIARMLSTSTANETVTSFIERWSYTIGETAARRTLQWLLRQEIILDEV